VELYLYFPYTFVAGYLVKLIDNYTFTLLCHNSVKIGLCYGVDDRGSNPGMGREGIVYLRHPYVQFNSGAQPASYRMGTGDSFPGGKSDQIFPHSAEAWNM
jgi:hypothetical protein